MIRTLKGAGVRTSLVSSIAADSANVYWTYWTIASSPGAAGLAVDATNLYWDDASGFAIRTMPIAGGPVATLAAGQKLPTAITVDAANVYWTNSGDG